MSMRRLVLSSVLMLPVVVPALGQQPPDSTARSGITDYTKDSLQTVKKMVTQKKAVVLDVRTKAEWDRAHLKIAHSIPMDVIRSPTECAKAVETINKDDVIYVHCQRGARAKMCAAVLVEMGYDARPLKVNYEDLGKAGFREVLSVQPVGK